MTAVHFAGGNIGGWRMCPSSGGACDVRTRSRGEIRSQGTL